MSGIAINSFPAKFESETFARDELKKERDTDLILFESIEKSEVADILWAANRMEFDIKDLNNDLGMTMLESIFIKVFEFGRKFEQERGK